MQGTLVIHNMEQRINTCICSYLPELPATIVLDRGRPAPRKFPAGPNPGSGLTEAGSPLVSESRRHLVLSLDAISTKASLATPKLPDN